MATADYPVISADSHITEHPETYSKYIDKQWRDKAPKMVDGGEKGDLFVIDGMPRPIAMGLVAAAGKQPDPGAEQQYHIRCAAHLLQRAKGHKTPSGHGMVFWHAAASL